MKLELRLSQKLVLTPQLRQAIEILQMSALELRQKIQNELQDNPFLDEEEAQTSEEAGEKNKEEERRERDEVEDYFQDSSDRGYVRKAGRSEDFIEGTVSRPDSLKEHLLWQLRLSVGKPDLFRIGEMVIGNLNDDGFLAASCAELAGVLKVSEHAVEEVVKVVQSFEPWGVAARDLRECLLIQLGHIQPRDVRAERIVSDHFDLLVHRKTAALQKALGLPRKSLDAALETIARLNPRPGQEYDNRETVYVVPDVIVKSVDGRFIVFLNDRVTPQLAINPHYDGLLKNYDAKDSARKFMEEKCLSALWLMRNIEQRRVTVVRVVSQILRFQSAFFEKGPRTLVPLTLRAIAEAIGMHESTVSRVTHLKYIQTPWGIFEMKYFFSSKLKSESGEDLSSRSVKEIIKDLVAHEEEASSDAGLVKKLNVMGVKISRRTVTKYRRYLRILPSHLRKK
jgi:RNA polymerase sigma-54 factor